MCSESSLPLNRKTYVSVLPAKVLKIIDDGGTLLDAKGEKTNY